MLIFNSHCINVVQNYSEHDLRDKFVQHIASKQIPQFPARVELRLTTEG